MGNVIGDIAKGLAVGAIKGAGGGGILNAIGRIRKYIDSDAKNGIDKPKIQKSHSQMATITPPKAQKPATPQSAASTKEAERRKAFDLMGLK